MNQTNQTPPPLTAVPPTPVAPLSYFERQCDTVVPFVTGLSWMAVLVYGLHTLAWVVQLVCYQFELLQRHRGMRWIRPDLIWTEAGDALVTGVICVAAIGCVRHRETGRYTLVIACLILCFVAPATYLAEAFPAITRTNPLWDPAGAIAFLSRYLLAGVQSTIIPIVLIRFFGRGDVRSLFR